MSARAIAIHGNEKSGERRANLEIKSECPALVVLDQNVLVINPAKCVFAVQSLKFLGHMVDGTGIRPLPKHIKAW